ncbi:hypothetical protein PY32053_01621 [Paracoccus yeei]|uniref:Uncharacterized protein n=1 Tax=Paracoccus yeei TaxID=147645 RepID=A0A386ULS6_9RHOB|nr:hypothetical protein [Paracoccus yeei]AYF01248.1 hypothetical protein PY32053_01621 [Paracoccus yeei]
MPVALQRFWREGGRFIMVVEISMSLASLETSGLFARLSVLAV